MKLSNRKQLLEEADMTLKSLLKEAPMTRQMRDKENKKKSLEILKTSAKIKEGANQKTVDFLVQKVSEDSRFKKMDATMSKLGGGNGPIVKKVQITMTVPVEFIWDDGFESSYYINKYAYSYIKSSVEKSPAFKDTKREMDTQIEQFIKDSEGLIKEIAKKHNTRLDKKLLSAVWNTLFLA